MVEVEVGFDLLLLKAWLLQPLWMLGCDTRDKASVWFEQVRLETPSDRYKAIRREGS